LGGPPKPHAITFGGGLRGIGLVDEMGSGGIVGSSDDLGSDDEGTFLDLENILLFISSSQV
jgi:hypothetical protein